MCIRDRYLSQLRHIFCWHFMCSAVYTHLRYVFIASVSGLCLAKRLTFSLASSTIMPAGLVCSGQGLECARGVSTRAVKDETFTKIPRFGRLIFFQCSWERKFVRTLLVSTYECIDFYSCDLLQPSKIQDRFFNVEAQDLYRFTPLLQTVPGTYHMIRVRYCCCILYYYSIHVKRVCYCCSTTCIQSTSRCGCCVCC